jgi:hypothetical protein
MLHLQKDAETLAANVVALWKAGKSVEAKKLCDEKIEALLEKYAASTVVKNCHQIYRKQIALAAGITGEYRFVEEPMCLFQAPIEITTAVNEASRDTVENQRNELTPITRDIIDKLLEVAVALVTNEKKTGHDIYGKAVGLALLTGRRIYAETLNHAVFERFDDSSVIFYGQAKGGLEKRETGYTIPVLGCSADAIVKAQSEVHEYIHNRPWYSQDLDDKTLAGKCKKQVQQVIDSKLDVVFNELRNEGHAIDPLHPHDLRKLYAFIVWVVINRQKSGFTQFAPQILGHSYTVKHSGKTRANTRSSESYEKYRLEVL